MDHDRRAVDFNCFIMRGDREGIKGRWPGSVNFTEVIFRGCN